LEAETIKNDNNYAADKRALLSVLHFSANWRLIAVTQLLGKSQKAGEILAGFF
jgi:hypothetical protein